MKKKMIKIMCCLVFGGAFLCFLPSMGLSQPCNATVGGFSYPSIQAAVSAAGPFTTITVSGTCNEIVPISANKNNITLDGGGTAIINSPNPLQGPIVVFGKQVTIRGFNITGGIDGIAVVQGGTATIGGPLAIHGNTIYNNQRSGILVGQGSFATIINNEIHDNGVSPDIPINKGGISVLENSSAWIGFSSPTGPAYPNIIRNNPVGLLVYRSAIARIQGNQIIDNAGDGIVVQRASQADISSNTIDGNGQNGIFVTQNSGVNLGNVTGIPFADLPNSGTNGEFGLSCSIGGYVDGVLGTLNGLGGALRISKGCFNSVTQ